MAVVNPIIVQAGGIDPSDANAAVGDVLATKTFYAGDTTKKTGTMVDRGTVNTDITTKAQEVTIAAGKHSGSGKVKISATEQAKIIAENIKKDITVLGVTGTLESGGGLLFPTSLTYTVKRSQQGMDMDGDVKFLVVDRYGQVSETQSYSLSGSSDFDVIITNGAGIAFITMALISDNCETLHVLKEGNYPESVVEQWSYPSGSPAYIYSVYTPERTNVIKIWLVSMW